MIVYRPIIQTIPLHSNYLVDVLRLDLIHPEISGNKWFKQKYNLQKAVEQGFNTIVTCGGAYSNHIAAAAAAAKLYKLRSIGIIRGEKSAGLNPTLAGAEANGMQLHFVSREVYAGKDHPEFHQYLSQFGPHYFIPEGGSNEAGMRGCKEILDPAWDHDYILCACGTAATFAGLVASARSDQRIIGISVLKGENVLAGQAERLLGGDHKIENTLPQSSLSGSHRVINHFSFSGYAKYDQELIDFKRDFESRHSIGLDYVYTSKLFFAASRLMEAGALKAGAKVLLIHSGGLQGNAGFEERYHRRLAR